MCKTRFVVWVHHAEIATMISQLHVDQKWKNECVRHVKPVL